jgi:hypothetical protein
MNASDCCAQCAAEADCLFWSFVVDPSQPTVPQGTCRWGTLAYCCVFHATGDNLIKMDPNTPSKQCVVVHDDDGDDDDRDCLTFSVTSELPPVTACVGAGVPHGLHEHIHTFASPFFG